MNILVTGATGFIGSNLCLRMLKEGHRVWGVDNFSTSDGSNLEFLRSFPEFRFYQMGVETPEFLEFFSSDELKFDRVYHLACPTGVPNIKILGEEMMKACSTGVWQVLSVAKKNDSRLLFTSSSESYGDPLQSPQAEEYTGNVDPLGPRANYEEGKRFAETLVKLHVDKYGLHGCMVRLFNVYGPKMALADQRVIPRFITSILASQPVTVYGDGTQIRTLCFVDDILDGFELVISKGVPGQIYNLGSDQQITIKDFADRVIKLMNSNSEIVFAPAPMHDHKSRMPVLDKIKALGWKQTVGMEDGLLRMIEDFRQRVKVPTWN